MASNILKLITVKKTTWKNVLCLFVMIFAVSFCFADSAMAVETCTDQPIFSEDGDSGGFAGKAFQMVEKVIQEVNVKLVFAMAKLYAGIIISPGYRAAVNAAVILMVTFFAVLFMFGLVQATFSQALVRLLKIGVIYYMMSPLGMIEFFFGILVQFFYFGTQCMIISMINIGTASLSIDWLVDLAATSLFCNTGVLGSFASILIGAASTIDVFEPVFGGIFPDNLFTAPLGIFEKVMNLVFAPRMLLIAFAAFTTGPYGPIMGLGILWGIWQLLNAILQGMKVYVLSMVVRAVLLGLAPIFIVFLLFERTKNLFTNWINQLVSFSLQPIMLFAFLSFFSVLITSAAEDMVPTTGEGLVQVCYTKVSNVGEMPFDWQSWRFMVDGEPYEGKWTYKGHVDTTGVSDKKFPIKVVNVMIFIILAYMSTQMVGVVVQMAAEISQGMTRLTDVPDALNTWFGGGGGGHAGGNRFKNQMMSRK